MGTKTVSPPPIAKLADRPFDALRSMLLGLLPMQGGSVVRVLDAKSSKEQPVAAPAAYPSTNQFPRKREPNSNAS